MMDSRITFDNLADLLEVLKETYLVGETASFMVDREGLSRVEGTVTGIEPGDSLGGFLIRLDNGESFFLGEVIAVNGIFRSDYTEC